MRVAPAELAARWRAEVHADLPAAVDLRHALHADPRVGGEEGPTTQAGARRIDPTVGVAWMVNQVRAGSANNVVPGSAVGSGTVRTMRTEDREVAHRAITEIASAVAAGHGCMAQVSIELGEPVLFNDVDLAVPAGEVLTSLGHDADPTFRSFGSDDFSHYGETTASLMMFVGTRSERGGLYDASYLPDDAYVSTIAEALLAGYCAAVAT